MSQSSVEALLVGVVGVLVGIFVLSPMQRRWRGDDRSLTRGEWVVGGVFAVAGIALIVYFAASGMALFA